MPGNLKERRNSNFYGSVDYRYTSHHWVQWNLAQGMGFGQGSPGGELK
jgi:hypothetical protein